MSQGLLSSDWIFGHTMISSRGFTITIFAEGGDMEGLLHIEKRGWNGKGVACPRSLLQAARSRDEFARPAVYILTGAPEKDGASARIYVGECDSVRRRLDSPAREKKFWNTVILFCATNGTLNKAHFRYLEARLLKLARSAQKAELDNHNKPESPPLSNVDSAEAEAFFEEMLLCLPLIGVHACEPAKPPRDESGDEVGKQSKLFLEDRRKKLKEGKEISGSELFELTKEGRTVAWGFAAAGGFLVQKGSRAVASTVPSAQPYVVS